MSSTLFIWTEPFKGILNGGGRANHRIYSYAQDFMPDTHHSFYINKIRYGNSLFSRFVAMPNTIRGYFNGITPVIISDIIDMANSYDNIFISSSLYGILAKRLHDSGYRGKIIVYFHNVEEEYFKTVLPAWFPLRGLKIRSAQHNDALSCRYADCVITLNQRDSDILCLRYNRSADIILPITLADSNITRQLADDGTLTSSTPTCTFIGSYFPANSEGILWFVRHVLPNVDIHLRIVGKGMSQLKGCSGLHNVEVIDNAPDLTPFYIESDFIILPIFSGSGMKVKTCESLMHARNIIATDEAFEGYDITETTGLDRCNNATEFIEAIRRYASNPIPRYNAASRSLYLRKHTPEVLEKKLAEVF